MLDQAALATTLFPVGDFEEKAQLRALAAELGLRTATKPDSQDVCFITSTGGRRDFLRRRIPFHPATVVDTAGTRVGAVAAVELVTIGQRKGLGLPGGGPKRFVVDIDRETATVVVGGEADVLRPALTVDAMSWVDGPVSGDVLVQCSAHGAARPATVELAGDVARRALDRAAAARRAGPERRAVRPDRHVRARRWHRDGRLTVTLHGRLVTLRPATVADVPALVAIRQTPAVRERWGGDGSTRSRTRSASRSTTRTSGTSWSCSPTAWSGAIQWSEADDPMYRHAGIDIFLDPDDPRPRCRPGRRADAVRPPRRRRRPPPPRHRPGGRQRAGDPLLRQGRLPAGRRDAPLRAGSRRHVARRPADGPAGRRADPCARSPQHSECLVRIRRGCRRPAIGHALGRARRSTRMGEHYGARPGRRRLAASRRTAPGRLGATSSAARWIAVPRGESGAGPASR